MNKSGLLLLLCLGLVLSLSPLSFGSRRTDADVNVGRQFAKFVVTVTGPVHEWTSYGWLWDDGERRNGVPWVVSAGTLEEEPSPRNTRDSNKSIYWWITETAWSMKSGPTEIEILNAIGAQGWRLVETQPGIQHNMVADDFTFDKATTYLFQK
jgi:hypothetical protein